MMATMPKEGAEHRRSSGSSRPSDSGSSAAAAPATCTPTKVREQGDADRAGAPSTPLADSALSGSVTRLAFLSTMAPADGEHEEAPPPATVASEPAVAPLTPPSSPPASPVNVDGVDGVQQAHDAAVDGETVTVFDWDDTLMATTVLTRQVRRTAAAASTTRMARNIARAALLCSIVSTSTQRTGCRAG
jgi:hypothetical protein